MSAVADGPVWKAGIVPVAELGPAIGVVQIDDDVGGIEQHDQVLREIGDRVDAQIGIAQQHGAGLGDGEGSADDGEIDIRQIPRRADAGDIPVARDLRHRRAHDLGARDLRPHRRQEIAEAGGSRNIPPMRCRLSLKAPRSDAGGSSSNSGNVGQRPVHARQVGADRGQDVVAAAHRFPPRFAWYQLWKVCLGGCGTSRCFPQALRPL